MALSPDEGRRLIEQKAAMRGKNVFEIQAEYPAEATPEEAARAVAEQLRRFADHLEREGRLDLGDEAFPAE